MTPLTLSAVVLAYNKEELLRECLEALETALAQVEGETELVVVLNAISPAERERLESLDRYVLVDPGRNLGFAAGANAGIARARGEWIALVNDDCVVAQAALAELLAAGAARPEVGSVAARIVFADRPDTINSAGLEVDELGIATERLLGQPVSSAGTEVVEVFGASATAALYRRAMLDEVGGFDASFFAYLEDADLAWRARMRGWRALNVPGACVRHQHSSTLGHRSTSKYYLVGRNRVRMLAKNATRAQLFRHGLAMVVYDLAYAAYAAARRRTFAPLRGRSRGLREWRSYRSAGGIHRGKASLAAPPGIRGALRRDDVYRRT